MIAALMIASSLFGSDAQYDGLHERRDRAAIRRMIGADPVRTKWCGLWLAYVMRKQGYRLPPHPALASSWVKAGKPVSRPRKGDIVVLRGHVARYVKPGPRGRLCLRGGNQNNQIGVSCNYRTSRVIAYRRPVK